MTRTATRAPSAPAAPAPAQALLQQNPAALLEQVLANTTVAIKARAINESLEKRITQIEELLPDALKGQAPRLVKRAILTFSRNPSLEKCTPQSFIRCVLEAAELGLAIDGRLGHAVPYKTEAQFQPDYKGLIAVAKRNRVLKDCYGDVVCKADNFRAYRQDGKSYLFHEYPEMLQPRGEVVGAYAVVVLPDGDWRYELMTLADLNTIRGRSKSFNGQGASPWKSDPAEMQKKTVIKRALKLYCEDPAIMRALELDDRDFDVDVLPKAAAAPVGAFSLRAAQPTAPAIGNGQAEDHGDLGPSGGDEPAGDGGQAEAGGKLTPPDEDAATFRESIEMAATIEALGVIQQAIEKRSAEAKYGPRWVAQFNPDLERATGRIEGSGAE